LLAILGSAIGLHAQPRPGGGWESGPGHDRDDREDDGRRDEDRHDDDEDDEDGVLLSPFCRPGHASRTSIRSAILRAEERRTCAATPCLASIVDDDRRDPATRSMAALALGEIACRVELPSHGRRRPHQVDGLPPVAIASLESAADGGQPALLRQAAARALGRALALSSIPTLEVLRSDADPVVRFIAAQSLTRVTETDHFDAAFRDTVVRDVLDSASTYRITDEVSP
jgi:hypothetical protein